MRRGIELHFPLDCLVGKPTIKDEDLSEATVLSLRCRPSQRVGAFMHVRFEDKTLIEECRRQPEASTEELARQLGVSQKRVRRLQDRVRRTDNPKTYFIADEQGRVKIGKSIEPIKRFKALQSANADHLTLLGICDDEEGEVHALFRNLRLTGEWFDLNDTLKTWIQENAEVPEMPSRRP